MFASFAAGVLLARALGVQGYGYYSIAFAVISIAAIPGELGLPFVVTREVAAASAKEDHARLFGMLRWADRASLWISGLVAILVAAAGLLLIRLGSQPIGTALLLGAPIVPLMALAKIRSGALQGLNHVVLGQLPWILLRPLVLLALVAFALAAGTLLTAPAAMLLNSLTAAAFLAFSHLWLRQRLPADVPAQLVKRGREWLASTIPMGLMEGMRVLNAELALLLVGLFSAPASAGMLRIANVTATTASVAAALFGQVALPIVARLHAQGDRTRMQRLLTTVAYAQFLAAAVLCMPLIITPKLIVGLVFGREFVSAAPALQVLALSQIVNAAFGPNGILLAMTHHERRLARAMAIGLAVSIVLVSLLALWAGVVGAAIAMLLGMTCWNVIAWRDARRLLALETSIFRWPWRPLGPC